MVNSPHLRVPDSSVSSRILLAPLVNSFSDILRGDQRRIRRFHDFHVILVGKNMLAVKLEDLRFTSDLEKNWAQLGPVCGLVEFFFIILQLQIR